MQNTIYLEILISVSFSVTVWIILYYLYSKSLVKACITLLPILGLTWLFGILAINKRTVVFEYLFCICNSFQVGTKHCYRSLIYSNFKRCICTLITLFTMPTINDYITSIKVIDPHLNIFRFIGSSYLFLLLHWKFWGMTDKSLLLINIASLIDMPCIL